ncbi:MAG: ribonuclease P protein component [Brachymonas sp.]|nr:ribonuclease P protein component [Brachymonas sp.]
MHSASARWFVLRNAQQFGAVMQQGQVIARSRHFMLHVLRWHQHALDMAAATKAEQPPRQRMRSTAIFPSGQAVPAYSGAIVPKRWAHRAVTRNLIKRQIRQAMLAHPPALSDGLAVLVRQRAAFDPSRFVSASSSMLRAAVRQELAELLAKADWQALACLPAPPEKMAHSLATAPK